MYGRKLSKQISDDYHNSKLTVKQIAKKYGVCVRTVYNVIDGKADRKGFNKQPRRYLSLTRNEAILLNDTLQLNNSTSPARYEIENRLRNIIEDLTY